MLYVSKEYALITLAIDSIMLIIVLLFRKPKHRTVKSSLNHNYAKLRLLGYYLVMSAVVGLVVVHYASFPSYLDYFVGLSIDALIFYTGLRVVTQNG
jgi:divalent metal cation (Fe/Co/Zn/Cd) transporter